MGKEMAAVWWQAPVTDQHPYKESDKPTAQAFNDDIWHLERAGNWDP